LPDDGLRPLPAYTIVGYYLDTLALYPFILLSLYRLS